MKTNKRFSPQYLPQYILKGLLVLISRLPYPSQYRLGRRLGNLIYRLAKSRVRIARTNLALCYPELTDAEIETIVKRNCQSAGIGMIEMATCWFMPPEKFKTIYTVNGLEHIEKEQNAGRGVILLGFHFTTLEIGGSIVADNSHRLAAMYRSHENPYFEQMMRGGRLRHADEVIRREEVRAAVKWLKSQGILWYAADQDYGAKGSLFVPFKGIDAATITATTKFAKLSGAKVLPLSQRRLDDGRGIEVTVHPPLENFSGHDDYHDALAINAFLEDLLDTHIDDYMWFHRRFKTRPQGEQGFYQKKKPRKTMPAETLRQIIQRSETLLQKDEKPYILNLANRQLVVLLYRKQHWLPLKLFPPMNRFLEKLFELDIPLKLDAAQLCPQEHCYALTFSSDSFERSIELVKAHAEQLKNL